jgi:hypothetical protein
MKYIKRELIANDLATNFLVTTGATYIVSFRLAASMITGAAATALLRYIQSRSDPANWEKDRVLFPMVACAICGGVAVYLFPDPQTVAATRQLGTALNDMLPAANPELPGNDLNLGHAAAHTINRRLGMGNAALFGFMCQIALRNLRNAWHRRKNPPPTDPH